MGLYTKSDAYDKAWWAAYDKRSEASRERLKDVEPINEKELPLNEFLDFQAREYELKNHLEPHSMTYDDVLYNRGVFTRAELKELNNDTTK